MSDRARGGVAAGLVVAVVAALALVAGLAASPPAAAQRAPLPGGGPQGRVPQFVVECGWSHRGPDDPIVHPGHAGASHLHEFFGSTQTGAGSTAADLLDGETTCNQQLDRAGYWVPALYGPDGSIVQPGLLVAYYRPAPGVDPTSVVPFPPGLAMIAGDASASEAQPVSVVSWRCGADPVGSSEPPACPPTAPLTLRLVFPDCWDGQRTDSPDHQGHVGRSRAGRCPAATPVAVPQLLVDVVYPDAGAGPFSLASGATRTAHGDFLNAWDEEKLATEVRLCLNAGQVCSVRSTRATG